MIEQHHDRFYPGLRCGQGNVSGASLKFLQFVSRVKTPVPEELQQLIDYYRERRDELALEERSASANRHKLSLWGGCGGSGGGVRLSEYSCPRRNTTEQSSDCGIFSILGENVG